MANLHYIKDLAERRNISIRELAEKVGVGENRIHVMCKTNSTKIETLEKIARALNVPISYFFDEERIDIRQAGGDYVEHGNIKHSGTEHNLSGGSAVEAELRELIAQLRSQLADKDEIIRLMKQAK